MNTQVKPKISIIVPSYNSRQTIDRCLAALMQQVTDHPYEVILVDSSTDDTAEYVQETYRNVKVIKQAQQTFPGQARNIGLEHAAGELTGFVDTKIVCPPNWVETACNVFAGDRCQAIVGTVKVNPHANLAGKAQFYSEFFDFAGHEIRKNYRLGVTCNLVIRRSMLGSNPFSGELRRSEDSLFFRFNWQRGIELRPDLGATYLGDTKYFQGLAHLAALGWWAAIIRLQYKLPGSWVAKSVVFSPLLFVFRSLRFLSFWIRFRGERAKVLVGCAVVAFLAAWTVGFFCASLAHIGQSMASLLSDRRHRTVTEN